MSQPGESAMCRRAYQGPLVNLTVPDVPPEGLRDIFYSTRLAPPACVVTRIKDGFSFAWSERNVDSDKKKRLEENGWRVGSTDDFLRPVCYILIGNIASGKTTYTKDVLDPKTIVVCGDNITDCVHAKYTEYSVGLKPLYKAVEHTIITQAAAADCDIVIDRMNASKKSRQRYISLAKSLGYSVVAVIMDQSDASTHATRRFECESRGVSLDTWIGVANGFVKQYEKPTHKEGFDDIRRGS